MGTQVENGNTQCLRVCVGGGVGVAVCLGCVVGAISDFLLPVSR